MTRDEQRPRWRGAREAWVQLPARIPTTLHRELKLHCRTTNVPLIRFVVDALLEKLGRERRR